MRPIKKTIFTLNVNGFAPEITELTFPLIYHYAKKIDAEFVIINERKFPDWPVTYEKLQIHDIGQQMQNDWNIYIDADALIHPNLVDFTAILPKDTVAHHGSDFASQRWKYDRFFLKDGRHIGSGNWFTIASDWCIDLWHPLNDLSLEQALSNIYPTLYERNCGCFTPDHLIDDYVLSRNIARYGLKFISYRQLVEDLKKPQLLGVAMHQYLIPREAKVIEIKKTLQKWGLK